jgi:hypothetical protein
MRYTNLDLRIIHAQACIAVVKANKTLAPDVDAFWPIYLRAVLKAARPVASGATQDEDDTARIDWLERNARSASYFDLVTLSFTSKESFEGWKSLREMIDIARRTDQVEEGDGA